MKGTEGDCYKQTSVGNGRKNNGRHHHRGAKQKRSISPVVYACSLLMIVYWLVREHSVVLQIRQHGSSYNHDWLADESVAANVSLQNSSAAQFRKAIKAFDSDDDLYRQYAEYTNSVDDDEWHEDDEWAEDASAQPINDARAQSLNDTSNPGNSSHKETGATHSKNVVPSDSFVNNQRPNKKSAGTSDEEQLQQAEPKKLESNKRSTTLQQLAADTEDQNLERLHPEQVRNITNDLVTKFPKTCAGKEAYLKIILSSNHDAAWDALQSSSTEDGSSDAICNALPTETQVAAKYGDNPIVYGLETCRAYRDLLLPINNNGSRLEPMPRVAGLYHTGTNALCRSFSANIKKLPKKEYSPYEVPWGKHLPPLRHRLNNTFPPENKEDRFRVLPIVIVRDPFHWMQSMCKSNYDARWEKEHNLRCPALVRFSDHKSLTTWTVRDTTHQSGYRSTDAYASLADMWSEWHRQYLEADYPRLMIRFEDTLYRQEQVMNIIKECIGLENTTPLLYQISNAKNHGRPTDFVSVLSKTIQWDNRHRGLNNDDRKYAQKALNKTLMTLFGYKQCPLEAPPKDLAGPFILWPERNTRHRDRLFTRAQTSKSLKDQSQAQQKARLYERRDEMKKIIAETKARREQITAQRLQAIKSNVVDSDAN